MTHRPLGRSGLSIAPLMLGGNVFGWTADETTSHAILDAFVAGGFNAIDTADVYSGWVPGHRGGESETVIGTWLKARGRRDDVVIATKVGMWPAQPGLSAANIVAACEGSLKRLQTDYIDLYQTHWPDHGTGYEEAMRALDDLVLAGKVRVLGCSNETAWGLMKSLAVSEREGLARYETIQNNFSLNNRRFEDALSQVCLQEGVSLIPYSPLAGGVLSGKYQDGARPDGARFSNYLKIGGRQAAMAQRFVNDKSLASTARFVAIAAETGISPVTLATAWSMQHDFVASTIVGATREDQLDDIFAAADLTLSPEVMKQIDAVTREILYPMG
jgi:aryl-alcohol dehydrogenase-like predicted oxidoreductase